MRDLTADADAAAIVAAIVSLGKSLKLEIIAEGVETHAQLSHLRGLGCDLAQGYLLGHPVDADQAATLLRQGPSVRLPPDPA